MDHHEEAERLLELSRNERDVAWAQVAATLALAHATLAQKAAPVVTNVQNNADRFLDWAARANLDGINYEHSAHPSIGDGAGV